MIKFIDTIKEIETKITNQKLFLFCEILEKRSKLRNYFEKNENLGIVPCYSDNEISIKKIILERIERVYRTYYTKFKYYN